MTTYLMGKYAAKFAGDWNENQNTENRPEARNMDLWNNSIGRQIGLTVNSIEEIGPLVAQAVLNGQTINDFNDPRQWIEPTESPSALDILSDFYSSRLGKSMLGTAIGASLTAQFGILCGESIAKNFWSFIKNSVSDGWTAAQQWIPRADPLTFDLDGDGIETLALDPNNPILFDHDGDGIKTATGWIGPDDAFLVLDRNGNGTVDNGTELFGDSTPLSSSGTAEDGFAALLDQDTNQDGVIDSNDTLDGGAVQTSSAAPPKVT